MLLIKTYLDKSKIHGIGLFAAEFVAKGTRVWKFIPGFDIIINKNDFSKLPEAAKKWILHFGYYNEKEGGYVVCIDDARFLNHSDKPNVDGNDNYYTVTNKDIKEGEELTCNYFTFDATAKLKLKR